MVCTVRKAFATSLVSLMVAVAACCALGAQAFATQGLVATQAEGGAISTQATSYDLWVGDKRVTSANAADVLGDGGTVKYNAATNTLTLNKANIKKAHVGGGDSDQVIGSGILYTFPSGTFTINVKGSNKISAPTVKARGSVASYTYGISGYSENKAKLKITGSGSLAVKAGGASITSCGLYSTRPVTVQGKAKLSCTGTTSTLVSNGIAAVGTTFTIKGSAQVTAKGETGAFYQAPKFSGYTPKVKAGYSSKKIKVNKKKPKKKVYTNYQYVKITKASGTAKKSGSSNAKKPGKVKITKVVPQSGRFWIYWNKVSKASGYELQVCTSKKFPASKTYSKFWDNQVSGSYGYSYISGLANGQKYYLRMRAYSNYGAKTYYGSWTSVKSVTPRSWLGTA